MAEEGEEKWKVLSLTHVEYQEGDNLAKLFAIFSLLPLVIVIVFITAFLLRRDLHTFTYSVVGLINYIANIALKKYLAEPRPKVRSVQFEEFGMPSSHSQFMWFCSSYMLLFSLLRLHNTDLLKVLCAMVVVGASTTMSYSRVYLQYHTVSQVVWGGVVGGVGAFLWFLLTQLVFTPLYPWVERWKISEYFMIRDTTSIPNILWFEYVTIRGEVNTRKKATARKNN
jgi:dolichyldiphosphatase